MTPTPTDAGIVYRGMDSLPTPPTGAAVVPPSAGPAKHTPQDFLNSVIGRPVIVKLNSGVDYKGEREEAESSSLEAWCHRRHRESLASKAGRQAGRHTAALATPLPSAAPVSNPPPTCPSPLTSLSLLVSSLSSRRPGLSRRVHEHGDGANRGVRRRPAKGQIRGLLHPRQQRAVHVSFHIIIPPFFQFGVGGEGSAAHNSRCFVRRGNTQPPINLFFIEWG